MKILLTILTLAIFVLAIRAGPLNRFKRNDDLVKGMQDLYSLSRDMLRISEPVIRGVLHKLPRTLEYVEYINHLEHLQADFQEYKTKPGSCLDKTFELLDQFLNLLRQYQSPSASPQAQGVMNLFMEYSDEDFENKLNAWEETFKNTNFEDDMRNADVKDILLLKPIMTEIC